MESTIRRAVSGTAPQFGQIPAAAGQQFFQAQGLPGAGICPYHPDHLSLINSYPSQCERTLQQHQNPQQEQLRWEITNWCFGCGGYNGFNKYGTNHPWYDPETETIVCPNQNVPGVAENAKISRKAFFANKKKNKQSQGGGQQYPKRQNSTQNPAPVPSQPMMTTSGAIVGNYQPPGFNPVQGHYGPPRNYAANPGFAQGLQQGLPLSPPHRPIPSFQPGPSRGQGRGPRGRGRGRGLGRGRG